MYFEFVSIIMHTVFLCTVFSEVKLLCYADVILVDALMLKICLTITRFVLRFTCKTILFYLEDNSDSFTRKIILTAGKRFAVHLPLCWSFQRNQGSPVHGLRSTYALELGKLFSFHSSWIVLTHVVKGTNVLSFYSSWTVLTQEGQIIIFLNNSTRTLPFEREPACAKWDNAFIGYIISGNISHHYMRRCLHITQKKKSHKSAAQEFAFLHSKRTFLLQKKVSHSLIGIYISWVFTD